MFSVTFSVPVSERDELIAELWELGTAGITDDPDFLRAFFEEESISPQDLEQRFEKYAPRIEVEEPYDWVQHARDQWRAFPVGIRFWMAPPWDESPPPEGRIRLSLRPGMACGSGIHPATQLCLRALKSRVHAAVSVLDVGAGSGILAEAAELLGSHSVIACDIDDEAVRIARANLQHSGVKLFTGSLRSVRRGSVDLIVANLNATTLKALAAELQRIGPPTLIVSGFREHETRSVTKAIGRTISDEMEQDDWACVIF